MWLRDFQFGNRLLFRFDQRIELRDFGGVTPLFMLAEEEEVGFVLRTMAQSTGGRVFFVDNPAQLASIYDQIADELATQYTIGYVSKNLKRDGAWRQVSVRINRTGMVARTKAGYYGPSKGQ